MKLETVCALPILLFAACCACKQKPHEAEAAGAHARAETGDPARTAAGSEAERARVEDRIRGMQDPAPAAGAQSQARAAQAGAGQQAAADPGAVRAAHEQALAWLAARQNEDGSWAPAESGQDSVGLTGLAVLALASGGSTPSSGAHARGIARGVQWLVGQQDADTGLVGKRIGHSSHYNHAIATLAMCRALKDAPSEQLSQAAQEAVNYISRARNPYGAWRYDSPPTGDSDTSVTTWMVAALAAAKDAGLATDPEAFAGARGWVEDVTEPSTARVGYNAVGSRSSRVVGINDQFPADRHEAMTACGMLTRMHAGTPTSDPMLGKQAALLERRPPEWAPEERLVDEYYWYFGSLATRELGGKTWETWKAAMRAALLEGQEREGEAAGSWAAAGPWAYSGGRVFSTALNALSLATML